jgi:hypothetical protein
LYSAHLSVRHGHYIPHGNKAKNDSKVGQVSVGKSSEWCWKATALNDIQGRHKKRKKCHERIKTTKKEKKKPKKKKTSTVE